MDFVLAGSTTQLHPRTRSQATVESAAENREKSVKLFAADGSGEAAVAVELPTSLA